MGTRYRVRVHGLPPPPRELEAYAPSAIGTTAILRNDFLIGIKDTFSRAIDSAIRIDA
jgi:hypothetical protein